VTNLGEDRAAELGFDGEAGVLVERVVPESPAARAGLKARDVLLSLKSVRIDATDTLDQILAKTKPGDRIGFAAWRDGRAFEGRLVLGERPPEEAEGRPPTREDLERELVENRRRLTAATTELIAQSDAGEADAIPELIEEIRRRAHRQADLRNRLQALVAAAAERRREREAATRRRIEVLRTAAQALSDADRRDLATTVEREIMNYRRPRRDPTPTFGQMAEILWLAAECLAAEEQPREAERCRELSRDYGRRHTDLRSQGKVRRF
jgi:hypothetical protein